MEAFDQTSVQEALRMANSPAGQQLIRLLQQKDPAAMENAMSKAAAGDISQAKKALTDFMNTSEAKALLAQLGGSNGRNGR